MPVDGADFEGFDGEVGESVVEGCDRFSFFTGGGCDVSAVFEGLEGGERWARELLGNWIPNEGSERDFRRVLYGMTMMGMMMTMLISCNHE